MTLDDKAGNTRRVDFTEIIRFALVDETLFDLNTDTAVDILDLVLVANVIGESESPADVNRDGEVNILDLVLVASHLE